MRDTAEPLTQLVEEIVGSGRVPHARLLAHLQAHGITLTDPDREITLALAMDSSPITLLPDRTWTWLPTLLEGRIFTHRLLAVEVAADVLLVGPDLEPLRGLFQTTPDQHLLDGASIRWLDWPWDDDELSGRPIPSEIQQDLFVLERGDLDGRDCTPGDVIGLRVTPDGVEVEVGVITQPPTSTAARELALQLSCVPWQLQPLAETIYAACGTAGHLFRTHPLPPLGSLLTALGHDHDDRIVAPRGVSLMSLRIAQMGTRLRFKHQLDRQHSIAAATTILLIRPTEPAAIELAADTLDDETLTRLAHPRVAAALCAEVVRELGDEEASKLASLAAALEPRAKGEVWSALPALRDLARWASDRGEAARGLALLRQAGTPPTHWLVRLLSQHADRAGRAPLADRAAWLYSKARAFVLDRERVDLLVLLRTRAHLGVDENRRRAKIEPQFADLALFEGGELSLFRERRGHLLPDDERELLSDWLDRPH